MKRKHLKFFIFLLLLVVVFMSIFSIKKYDIKVHKTGDLNINKPITFKLETTEYGRNKAFGDINVNIYNKHNNDDKMEAIISPYQDNRYQFVFIPTAPGEYYFNITYQPPGNESLMVINQNFKVK